jgi:hypothetical protein
MFYGIKKSRDMACHDGEQQQQQQRQQTKARKRNEMK